MLNTAPGTTVNVMTFGAIFIYRIKAAQAGSLCRHEGVPRHPFVAP